MCVAITATRTVAGGKRRTRQNVYKQTANYTVHTVQYTTYHTHIYTHTTHKHVCGTARHFSPRLLSHLDIRLRERLSTTHKHVRSRQYVGQPATFLLASFLTWTSDSASACLKNMGASLAPSSSRGMQSMYVCHGFSGFNTVSIYLRKEEEGRREK